MNTVPKYIDIYIYSVSICFNRIFATLFSTQNEQSILRIALGNHALILEWKHPYSRSPSTTIDFFVSVTMPRCSPFRMNSTAQDSFRYSRKAVSHTGKNINLKIGVRGPILPCRLIGSVAPISLRILLNICL